MLCQKVTPENIYRWNVWGFLQNNTGKECGGVWDRDETSLAVSSWWFTVLLGLLVYIYLKFSRIKSFFFFKFPGMSPPWKHHCQHFNIMYLLNLYPEEYIVYYYYMVHNLWNQHIIQTTLTFASHLIIYLFMSVNADL